MNKKRSSALIKTEISVTAVFKVFVPERSKIVSARI